MWMHGPWHGFLWMWILPLIFFVVILLFFRRGDWPMCGGHQAHKGESAREILDRRYASGEISREEYQRMKKDIE